MSHLAAVFCQLMLVFAKRLPLRAAANSSRTRRARTDIVDTGSIRQTANIII